MKSNLCHYIKKLQGCICLNFMHKLNWFIDNICKWNGVMEWAYVWGINTALCWIIQHGGGGVWIVDRLFRLLMSTIVLICNRISKHKYKAMLILSLLYGSKLRFLLHDLWLDELLQEFLHAFFFSDTL